MSTAANEATRPAAEAMPEVKGGVVAYLTVSSASKASDFYQRAFGGKEVYRVPVDDKGRTMHIHLYINGGSLMLCDAYPEHGYPLQPPQSFNLTLQVTNIDAWFERAVAAGAEVVLPITEMFWGARYAQVRDPFGVIWALNQPLNG